jgi:hypothetical protein
MNQEVPNDYKRFNDWSLLGCKIIKGSKATWFNGEAFFHKSQIQTPNMAPRQYWKRYQEPQEISNPEPSDRGGYVSDVNGNIVGTRGYTKFNSDEWVPVTHYPDGSSVVHCGGPCGPMYVDEFGNT